MSDVNVPDVEAICAEQVVSLPETLSTKTRHVPSAVPVPAALQVPEGVFTAVNVVYPVAGLTHQFWPTGADPQALAYANGDAPNLHASDGAGAKELRTRIARAVATNSLSNIFINHQ
jgi:hypothetical protein